MTHVLIQTGLIINLLWSDAPVQVVCINIPITRIIENAFRLFELLKQAIFLKLWYSAKIFWLQKSIWLSSHSFIDLLVKIIWKSFQTVCKSSEPFCGYLYPQTYPPIHMGNYCQGVLLRYFVNFHISYSFIIWLCIYSHYGFAGMGIQ